MEFLCSSHILKSLCVILIQITFFSIYTVSYEQLKLVSLDKIIQNS